MMIRAGTFLLTLAAGTTAFAIGAAAAPRRGLTEDMIRTLLESQHVCINPPCPSLDMIDRRQGAAGWHSFRLDSLTIRVQGNRFTIVGDTTQLR